MYCDFFGLDTLAFNNTPDPRFFFNTPDHEEALASLLYAAEQRKGFVLVTGEVGSGKTLLSRLLLNEIGTGTRTAVINNTRLAGHELLLSICREFDIEVDENATTADTSHRFERFLLEQYARDRLTVLILDEAQNLPLESFEELRMLGNLEADDAKLLQVLILGQPELQETFLQPSMRQLHQRIFRTFHLQALSKELTAGYVQHRLQVAGLPEGQVVFDAEAIDAVFHHSEGIPRLINQICDNAMLAAYTESSRAVSAQIVNEVVEQMMSLTVPTQKATPRGPLAQQFLSTPSSQESDAASAAALRANPSAGSAPMAGTSVSSPGGGDTAELILRRLAAMEQAVAHVQHDAHTTHVQRPAAETLADTRQRDAELEERLTRLVQEGRLNAGAREQRASELAEQERNEVEAARKMRSEAAKMLEEVHSSANGQQKRISGLLSQEQAEFEAGRQMREQAAEMVKKVDLATQEANERLGRMLEEAATATSHVEKQAAETLQRTEEQARSANDQVKQLIDEARAQAEAHQSHVIESIREEQAQFRAAKEQVDALAAEMKTRAEAWDRHSNEALGYVQSQVSKLSEQIEGLGDLAKTRTNDVNASLDAFMEQMRDRVETSHRQLAEAVSTAQKEVSATCESLGTTKDQIAAEAAAGRSEATQILDQTRNLLVKTREQASTLLAGLRAEIAQQTERAENLCRTAVVDGSKTLTELHAKLNETRMQSDRSRTEFESLVQNATGELANVRSSFEAGLVAHKQEIGELSHNAANIKEDIAKRFEEARKDLDAALEPHHQTLRRRMIKLFNETDEHVTATEAKAGKTVERLQSELSAASRAAERIYSEIQQSVAALQEKADTCKQQYGAETTRAQAKLAELVDGSRATLKEAQTGMDEMSHQATATSQELAKNVDQLRQAAKTGVANVGQELEACLKNALENAEAIHTDSEDVAKDFAARMDQTQTQAEAAISHAEEAVTTLREQSKASLAEVRSGLAQMNKHGELLRRDMVEISDEVQDTAKTAHRQLQQTADNVTEQVTSLRDAAQKDAEANHRRLATLREQVEKGAEQIHRNAGRLLDQVQQGASSLREHADVLLSQSQSGSEKIGEQAANLLSHAQMSAERFREQAESLLRKAEANANAIRTDLQALRSEALEDSEQVSSQIDAVKQDIAESRRESVGAINEAKNIQEAAKRQADDLIDRADQVTSQTGKLLKMPRELVDEANQRAGALSEMSKKVSSAFKQLSAATNTAERNRGELDQANTAADEKLNLLKRHSARVGQLVGIIRQLYGTMDARLDRLRTRLDKADDLCRSVPQEIESFRRALAEEAQDAMSGVSTDPPRSHATPPTGPKPMETRVRPSIPDGTREPASAETAISATQMAKGSLGDLAQRNRKLNEWLRNVLGNAQDQSADTEKAKTQRSKDVVAKA